MKKIIIPIVILLIGGLIYINYLSYKAPQKDKLLSQQTTYSLYQTNALNVLLYANRKTAYQHEDAIITSYISNLDESKKLTVQLKSISKMNQYKYLEENFTCYSYTFELPAIDSYFFITEAYLTIRLKSSEEVKLKLGTFDYYTDIEPFSIVELYGTRYEDFPTLKSLTFKLDLPDEIKISRIHLSNAAFTIIDEPLNSNEAITIELPKNIYKIEQLAIKVVYYIDEQLYEGMLPYYLYYTSNENPLIYGNLNDIKILN